MDQSYRVTNRLSLPQEAGDLSSEGIVSSNRRHCITGRESLMSSVVKAASAFNNILLKNCSICTLYCDKQVQYEEYVQQQYDVGTGAMGHLYSQLNATAAAAAPPITTNNAVATGGGDNDESVVGSSNFINPTHGMRVPLNSNPMSPAMSTDKERIEVERYYREFLFDEESVVRSVGSRGAIDEEE